MFLLDTGRVTKKRTGLLGQFRKGGRQGIRTPDLLRVKQPLQQTRLRGGFMPFSTLRERLFSCFLPLVSLARVVMYGKK